MMKKNLLNILLALALTLSLLIVLAVKTFQPAAVLPKLNVSHLVLLSLAVLLCEHYLAPDQPRRWGYIALYSALTFLILPLASSLASGVMLLKLAIGGCAVFIAVTWLFTSVVRRIASGGRNDLAVIVSALGIFLASQAFTGILL